jgi:phosphoribosylformylglycinamidine cyclo-ligase
MAIDYKTSGVDIQAGEETVDKIKPMIKKTHRKEVLSEIGLFGGFFDAKFPDYNHPVLVASTDGVGTKLKVAYAMNKHNTVGNCLVNHCVNDILTSGARPLFFLDYFATGKLNPEIATQVIEGFANGCVENGVALLGGETAEMPSIYSGEEYDVSGTIVGVVEKDKIVDGKKIIENDVLIGLPSNGLHTNGYSLARNVLFSKYKVDEYVDSLQNTIGDELLKIHRSYLKIIDPLLNTDYLKGISHITGGGIIGNTKRIIPKGLKLQIDWSSWELPAIFKLIQETGNIADAEMRKVFNLGIGLILVVAKQNVDLVLEVLQNENPKIIGKVISE